MALRHLGRDKLYFFFIGKYSLVLDFVLFLWIYIPKEKLYVNPFGMNKGCWLVILVVFETRGTFCTYWINIFI